MGPFLSGGLFSISTRVKPKGEALAWGVFGGIALLGCLASFGIRGESLESGEWEEEDAHQAEDEDDDTDEEDERANVGR